MIVYMNIVTMEYPRHIGDLQLLGWEQGEPLPENWVEVHQDNIPVIEKGQTYQLQEPQLIDGVWRAIYEVREMTEEEKAIVQYNLEHPISEPDIHLSK